MKDMIIPNRKAKRARTKSLQVLDVTRLRKFHLLFPEYKKVTQKEFHQVMRVFHEELIDDIVDNRDGVILPNNLGFLQILSFKYKNVKRVDYAKSIKYGKRFYFKNWDTDGYLGKVIYKSFFKNRGIKFYNFWIFELVRPAKNKISAAFRENYQSYRSFHVN